MKLLRSYLFQTLLFVVAVISMQSCSCEKREGVGEKIDYIMSDDVAVAMTGDITRLFDALDVTVTDGVPQMPKYMTDLFNSLGSTSARKDIETAFENLKGLGYNNFVTGVKVSGGFEMLAVFSVEDEDEFIDSVAAMSEDNEKGSADGYDTVGNDDFQILVKDHLGFIAIKNGKCLGDEDAAELIDEWAEAAEKSPLASWKKTYLTEARVLSMLVMMEPIGDVLPANVKSQIDSQMSSNMRALGLDLDVWSMNLALSFDLNGDKANLTSSILDNDGKVVKNPCQGNFNAELIEYAGASDVIAAGLAVNDHGMDVWQNGISKSRNQLRDIIDRGYAPDQVYNMYNVLNYLDAIIPYVKEYVSEGGVFVSAGLSENADIENFNPVEFSNYHMVMAADLKQNKAQEGFDRVCTLLDEELSGNGSTVTREGNAYKRTLQVALGYDEYTGSNIYATLDIYVELRNNILLVSNSKPVKGSANNFDAANFTGSSMALQLHVPAGYPALKTFDINCGIDAVLTTKESCMQLNITGEGLGAGEKLVPGFCKLLTGMM